MKPDHTHLLLVTLVLCIGVLLTTAVGSLRPEGFGPKPTAGNGYSPTYVAPTEEFPVVLYTAPNYEGEAFSLRVGKHTFQDVFPADVPRPEYKRWIRSVQMLPGASFMYRNAIGGVQDAVYTANRAMIKFRLDNLRNRNGVTDSVTVTYTKTKEETVTVTAPPPPADFDLRGRWHDGNIDVQIAPGAATGTYTIYGTPGTVQRLGLNTYKFSLPGAASAVGHAVSPTRLEFDDGSRSVWTR